MSPYEQGALAFRQGVWENPYALYSVPWFQWKFGWETERDNR